DDLFFGPMGSLTPTGDCVLETRAWRERLFASRHESHAPAIPAFYAKVDALYIVPQKIGSMKLRLPKPKPRKEEVYFIGATNVPIEALDPALIRPGRMGRHIWFRTPTKGDRKDIFDLYMAKVDHDPELDT